MQSQNFTFGHPQVSIVGKYEPFGEKIGHCKSTRESEVYKMYNFFRFNLLCSNLIHEDFRTGFIFTLAGNQNKYLPIILFSPTNSVQIGKWGHLKPPAVGGMAPRRSVLAIALEFKRWLPQASYTTV